MNVLIGVVSYASAWVMPRAFVEQIRSGFPHHVFLEAWDFDAIRRLIPEADVAFVPQVDSAMLASAPRLRWIQAPAAGVAHMLSPEMVASPVVITSAKGVRARAIAEHVLGIAIVLTRRFDTALRRQFEHKWAQDELEGETTEIVTLKDRRLGIIGLGSIGSEVARLAAAFGLRVSAVRRRIDQPCPPAVEAVFPADRLGDLLAASDIVVLCAAQTASTERLIGARELAQMRPGTLFINVARGTLVDDDALVAALRSGHLGGAGLDVFTREPLDPDSPYWDLPNVVVTPHTSGAMAAHWPALVELFSENLRRFDAGQPLLNVVDKAAGY